jgi:hypothetical protein
MIFLSVNANQRRRKIYMRTYCGRMQKAERRIPPMRAIKEARSVPESQAESDGRSLQLLQGQRALK